MPTRQRHREVINLGLDKRFVRRDEHGRFRESPDVGRSGAADRQPPSRHEAMKARGDTGEPRTH